jgi:lysophospholipase L1-like esterase
MPKAINAGFGGSTIASLCWFFDRIVEKANPSNLVVYAGENDLGDHRHPEEVCLFTVYLIEKTREKIGDIPFTFVGVKPSPGRVNILDRIKFTNELIEKTLEDYPNTNFLDTYYPMLQPDGYPDWEYFADDGLHLNDHGYDLLTRLFLDKKEELF